MILFFDSHGLYSPWPKKEILAVLRQTKKGQISKTRGALPTKIGFHAFHVNLYLHEFFEPIYFLVPMDYSPWFKREIWRKTKRAKSSIPEMPRPPNSMHVHNLVCHYLHKFFEPILFFYIIILKYFEPLKVNAINNKNVEILIITNNNYTTKLFWDD